MSFIKAILKVIVLSIKELLTKQKDANISIQDQEFTNSPSVGEIPLPSSFLSDWYVKNDAVEHNTEVDLRFLCYLVMRFGECKPMVGETQYTIEFDESDYEHLKRLKLQIEAKPQYGKKMIKATIIMPD